jgi:hypothetical protein
VTAKQAVPTTHKAKAAYADAVEAASMRNVRLAKSDFNADPESFGGDRKTWKMGFGCDVVSTHYDAARKRASALIAADAYCKIAHRRIISLKCSYVVAYDIDGDPDQTAVSQFLERVGTFAAYPYFRAHFAEVTSQAGIMLAPLPVMKEGKRVIAKSKKAVG